MELNEHLLKIIRMMKEAENLALFPASAKLSQTEFRLLREVILEQEKGSEIISSELARRLGITRSAVSQIVTKMEKNGIVERVDSPLDRKIAYVHLSDDTRAVYEEQCKLANAFFERVNEEYGEEKLRKFEKLYNEFLETFQKVYNEMH